jgi:hypothetical protein
MAPGEVLSPVLICVYAFTGEFVPTPAHEHSSILLFIYLLVRLGFEFRAFCLPSRSLPLEPHLWSSVVFNQTQKEKLEFVQQENAGDPWTRLQWGQEGKEEGGKGGV